MPRSGGESGDVGHETSSHSDHHVVAREAEVGEPSTQTLDGREILVRFPAIDEQRGVRKTKITDRR